MLHLFPLPNKKTASTHHFIKNLSLGLILFLIIIHLYWITHNLHQASVLGTTTNLSSTEIIAFTNRAREKHHLPPLQLNDQLTLAAQEKARNMLQNNYWEHVNQNNPSPWNFISAAGYNFEFAGENLAQNYSSADKLVNAWLDSPSHRDNLLSPHYQHIGVAVIEGPFQDKSHAVLIVSLYASPAPEILNPHNYASTSIMDNFTTSLISYPPLLGITTSVIGIILTIVLVMEISRHQSTRQKPYKPSFDLWHN